MRCAACNEILSDSELTLRLPDSGKFADLCKVCYGYTFDMMLDEVDSIIEFDIDLEAANEEQL